MRMLDWKQQKPLRRGQWVDFKSTFLEKYKFHDQKKTDILRS